MDWISPTIGTIALITAFIILPAGFRNRLRRMLRSLKARVPLGGGQQ
jgi:hypothetical protein